MSVVVQSDDFISLIKAAKVTAYSGKDDPISQSVYIYSTRAPGAEGGDTDVLVAVTSDGVVSGQISVEAVGRFDQPILFELTTTKWLIDMITTAKKQSSNVVGKDADFTVELSVISGMGMHGALLVQTLSDGQPSPYDTKANPPLSDVDLFNIKDVIHDLSGVVRSTIICDSEGVDDTGDTVSVGGDELPKGEMIAFDRTELKVFSGITAALGHPIRVYPLGHPANRRIVTCGENWRGSVPGTTYPFDADVNYPEVELIAAP